MEALSTILPEEHQRELRRYLYNHQVITFNSSLLSARNITNSLPVLYLQNADGGWALHIEGRSTMFCTVLNYVALRLLGEGVTSGDGAMDKARTWILDRGGATFIPSWGKFWLSVLSVYEWDGHNPLPPELWLLPYILPIHPG